VPDDPCRAKLHPAHHRRLILTKESVQPELIATAHSVQWIDEIADSSLPQHCSSPPVGGQPSFGLDRRKNKLQPSLDTAPTNGTMNMRRWSSRAASSLPEYTRCPPIYLTILGHVVPKPAFRETARSSL
jgi:hypothetical protein